MKFRIQLLVLFFGVLLTNVANAESQHEQLKQMVEQLQQSPDDNGLREKIIKLALKTKPAPAVPEEARRHFVKAVTLQKDAKTSEDYDLPIQEYRQALLLAPWWSDAYYDLASALDLKQQYADAIQNLKFSILASPEGPDARAAQDKVYALEAKNDVHEKKKREAADQAADEAKYEWLLGKWKFKQMSGSSAYGNQWSRDIVAVEARRKGNQVEFGFTGALYGTVSQYGKIIRDSSYSSFSDFKPTFRATLTNSGYIEWQHDWGREETDDCPSQKGWQNFNPVISSDHRMITFRTNMILPYSKPPCSPYSDHDDYIEWTFTRE